MAAIKELSWNEYRPFVLKLFEVHENPHKKYGIQFDGYLGTNSVLVWNYPDYKKQTIDYGYVEELHESLGNKAGDRFYIIAPVIAMAFAEDELQFGSTTFVFLKVPMSVLLRLLEVKEPGALKQPAKELDVNEVIDAVGYDFISQPLVQWQAKKANRKGELFKDFVLELKEFRAQTLSTEPEDFQNFETFSMAMVDLDYNGDVFRLSTVFWGEDLLQESGGLGKANVLEIRIPEQEFRGKRAMFILCDRYGNEKNLVLMKEEFEGRKFAKSSSVRGKRRIKK